MSNPNSDVDSVQWTYITSNEHEIRSFAKVSESTIIGSDGEITNNGPCDLRLGTTDHRHICSTCKLNTRLCPGHPGHIKLKCAVLQPTLIKEIKMWLSIVCIGCGELLISQENLSAHPLNTVLKKVAGTDTDGYQCPHCETANHKIIKNPDDNHSFSTKVNKEVKILYPNIIKNIFEKISDENVLKLGRKLSSHPKNYVYDTIMVTPNNIRPNTNMPGVNNINSITTVIQSIVKFNRALPDQLPEEFTNVFKPDSKTDSDVYKNIQGLQICYYEMTNGKAKTTADPNSKQSISIARGKPLKSLLANLPSKKGTLRFNSLGKRVFDISRTTISGNSSIRVDEIGLPINIAKILQVRVTVQSYNFNEMMTYFLNGREQYPGCTLIKKHSTGKTYDVSTIGDNYLGIGDVIYRDVIDGDIAFFNRQPTLNRSSIGAHWVKVINDPNANTFQMNVLSCEWYNADFDGDQMHLWVAKSPETRIEAKLLSSVSNVFLNTSNHSAIGLVQDSVIGSYLLSRKDAVYDRFHTMKLFANTKLPTPSIPMAESFNGNEIITLFLQNTPINYSSAPTIANELYQPANVFSKSDLSTVIEHGEMKSGVIDKKAISSGSTKSIFTIICQHYGVQIAMSKLFELQQITHQCHNNKGASVSMNDLIIPDSLKREIETKMSERWQEANENTRNLLEGRMIPPINMTRKEFYEQNQINCLKTPDEIINYILQSPNIKTNGLFRMISTGSKGKNPNLIQITGAIGQTLINGVRITRDLTPYRSTIYSPSHSLAPEVSGFIRNNYIDGMTVQEFTHQAMHDRYDIICKAISTAVTGFFMRKCVFALQSIVINNLRMCIKHSNITQLIYGGSGVDTRYQLTVPYPPIKMNDKELYEECALPLDVINKSKDKKKITESIKAKYEKIKEDRDYIRYVFLRQVNTEFGGKLGFTLDIPVHVDGLIKKHKKSSKEPSAENIIKKIKMVEDLTLSLSYLLMNEEWERDGERIPEHMYAATRSMRISIRYELRPLVLSTLSINQIRVISEEIKVKFVNSLIDYGVVAGVLAAQIIVAPITQYMLDSSHRSVATGGSRKNITRIYELYKAVSVDKEENSTIIAPLINIEGESDAEILARAHNIANQVEELTFDQFISKIEVLLEPLDNLVYPDYLDDKEWIDKYFKYHPLVAIPSDITNWCIRVVLDKTKMVLKTVGLETIIKALSMEYPESFIVHTQESAKIMMIRIWLKPLKKANSKAVTSMETKVMGLYESLKKTPIQGIPNIKQATAKQEKITYVGEGGELAEKNRSFISTSGTNLYEVMGIIGIDCNNTISSSVGDVNEVLGIEAARKVIINETANFTDDCDLTHVNLISDEMVRTGRYTSVEQAGLKKREPNNVLLRMANASPASAAQNAALMNTKNPVHGIACRQTLGLLPNIGTAFNEILLNQEFLDTHSMEVREFLEEI